jgi:hypothetical protein
LDFKELKALGIVLRSSTAIERAYEKLKAVPVIPIAGTKLLVLDLNSLPRKPIPFKEIFLRWAIAANEGRLLIGDDPIFPLALVKRCPLWKAIKMPLKALDLTQERLFNKPTLKVMVIGAAQKIGSLNKRKR